MEYKSVSKLLKPLLTGGREWQYIDINGKESKPKFYFSFVQWIALLISALLVVKLPKGISKELIGYVMSAFSISVSLFMSLLVSIFDKFENTSFDTKDKPIEYINRLIQKKNFFKKFISITSYLVVMSILIIVLSSFTYIFNVSARSLNISELIFDPAKIDWFYTLKCSLIFIYRIALNYFLLDYLILTFFIAGSAYEYYISELNKVKIKG